MWQTMDDVFKIEDKLCCQWETGGPGNCVKMGVQLRIQYTQLYLFITFTV